MTWDGGGDGTSWSDPANWDALGLDQLPANGDDVMLDVPGNPTVVYSESGLTLASLTSQEGLQFVGGSLTLSGTADIQADVSLGAITLIADGPTASFSVSGTTAMTATTIRALNGATITLPAASYAGTSSSNSQFLADGAGSVLDLSSITTLSGGTFIRTFFVTATNGGEVDLSGLTEITGGATWIESQAAGSEIDLSSLVTFNDTNGNRSSRIDDRGGGTIVTPSLASLDGIDVFLQSGTTVTTSQITSFTTGSALIDGVAADFGATANLTNTSITLVSGGTANLNNATVVNGASFLVYDGVTLSLPMATAYGGQSNNGTTWRAQGVGSRLEFPALTEFSGGSFISTMLVQARDGGLVDFPALAQITGGATQLLAEDTSSEISAPLLTSHLDNNGNRTSSITAASGGTISTPSLTTLDAVNLSLDATGTFSTSQITSYTTGSAVISGIASDFSAATNITNSSFTLNAGGTVDLTSAAAIGGASFLVNDGVTLSLPSATTYSGQTNSNTTWRATGGGSRLEFPALTQFSGGSFISTMFLEAVDGGTVYLPNSTGIVGGATQIKADGAGSHVAMPQSASFLDTNGNRSSTAMAVNGGTIAFIAGSVAVDAVTITATDTGTILAGTLNLSSSSVLTGAGTVTASVVNSGRVDPGASLGQLVIEGSYTQTAGGVLDIELTGLIAADEYDVLSVTGTATLDGTLEINLLNGFLPTELNAFQVITFADRTGDFNSISGRDLSNDLVLDNSYANTSLTLRTLPELTISAVTLVEGDTGSEQAVFDLQLSTGVGFDIQVDYSTADNTAHAGVDYIAKAGVAMIPAGGLTTSVTVEVLGDLGLELDEIFFLQLSSPVDVALAATQSTATITNNDVLPAVQITDVVLREPTVGVQRFEFAVTVSYPGPDPVTVEFATQDGGALAGSDYVATSGSLTFAPSITEGLISDGSDGVFHPTSNTTLALPPDGVFHFESIHIPAGVTVQFTPNALNTPAILLSRQDVRIEGQIYVSASGRQGGPGGGNGGLKGVGIMDGTDGIGLSPGTGGGAMVGFVGSAGGAGGLATAGAMPVRHIGPLPGSPGDAVPFPEDMASRGGSGGGGGGGWERFGDLAGGDGGGAGGGIVISAAYGQIVVDGAIRANGAKGGTSFANAFGWGGPGGGGSGGVIDLQAEVIQITGNATLQAIGGDGGGIGTIPSNSPEFSSGANGGEGFIRLIGNQLALSGVIEGTLVQRSFGQPQTIVVDVLRDNLVESAEQFSVVLSGVQNGVLVDPTASGTILDSQQLQNTGPPATDPPSPAAALSGLGFVPRDRPWPAPIRPVHPARHLVRDAFFAELRHHKSHGLEEIFAAQDRSTAVSPWDSSAELLFSTISSSESS